MASEHQLQENGRGMFPPFLIMHIITLCTVGRCVFLKFKKLLTSSVLTDFKKILIIYYF